MTTVKATPTLAVAGPALNNGLWRVVGSSLLDGANKPRRLVGANIGVNASIGGTTYPANEAVTAHTAEAAEWGWNGVRLNVYVSTQTPWIASYGHARAIADTFAATDKYLAAGFVVILGVMDQTAGVQDENDAARDDIEDFFVQAATRYVSDSRVWFNVNEVVGVNTADEFQQFHGRMYDAIRNTGNESVYVADILVNAQDGRYNLNATRAWEPILGPAFLANTGGVPRRNVLFGLHNYGGMIENNWGQELANTTYNEWADKMTDAGLAFYTGETGYPQATTDGNYPRFYKGFQAALQQRRSVGVLVWHGTFDVTSLKTAMVDAYNGRPFWYGGSGNGLSQMGQQFWNFSHNTSI
jgi:hypothetical protein